MNASRLMDDMQSVFRTNEFRNIQPTFDALLDQCNESPSLHHRFIFVFISKPRKLNVCPLSRLQSAHVDSCQIVGALPRIWSDEMMLVFPIQLDTIEGASGPI